MITNALLNVFYWIVWLITAPIRTLDNVELPVSISNAITYLKGFLYIIDPIIPVATVGAILGIAIAFETAYFSYKFVMWLIKRLPTQS